MSKMGNFYFENGSTGLRSVFVICACALSVLWSSACVFATQQWRFMDFEIQRSMNFGEVVLQFVQLFRLGGSGF